MPETSSTRAPPKSSTTRCGSLAASKRCANAVAEPKKRTPSTAIVLLVEGTASCSGDETTLTPIFFACARGSRREGCWCVSRRISRLNDDDEKTTEGLPFFRFVYFSVFFVLRASVLFARLVPRERERRKHGAGDDGEREVVDNRDDRDEREHGRVDPRHAPPDEELERRPGGAKMTWRLYEDWVPSPLRCNCLCLDEALERRSP